MLSIIKQFVHVQVASMVHHLSSVSENLENPDQNVHPMMNVQMTKHVLISVVSILVRIQIVFAVSTLNVEYNYTDQFVYVEMDIPEMLTMLVMRLVVVQTVSVHQPKLALISNVSIHALTHNAVEMLFVRLIIIIVLDAIV
jgi:hypothetical protein